LNKPYISHVEWCCQDIEAAAEFFQTLFGWQFKPFGNSYLLWEPETGAAVGLLRTAQPAQTADCRVFVSVDSIDDYLQRAMSLGGSVYVVKTAIPDYGWYAQIKDTQGNIIGLFESLRTRSA